MKALVLGAGGVLGRAFVAGMTEYEVGAVGREALDVRDPRRVLDLVKQSGADIVINCAAHTDVEAAERDPDPAFAANAVLPGLLGQACRGAGARLVHVSSTGCYGAWKDGAYTEFDAVQPTTVHHRSKIAGEEAVAASGCEHLILRTGWLFGGEPGQAKNFVWRRMQEAGSRPSMESDASQAGNPTLAADVAAQTLALLDVGLTGLFNCVARGRATRFDYVARIVATAGLACEVRPGAAFARAARVSPNETAVNYRLDLLGLDQMPEWTTSLDAYVASLKQKHAWSALEAEARSATPDAGPHG